MPYTLGEEGLEEVWERRAEEEEVRWRARGHTGVTYSVLRPGGGELGARAPPGSRAWGSWRCGGGGGRGRLSGGRL